MSLTAYAVFEPESGFPVSVAMRAGLASFMKVYSDLYAKHRIWMNNLLPGLVNIYPESPDLIKRIPLGRYGTVEKIAKTVRFLLSADAGYITGQNLRGDGGITRSVV